MRVKFIKEIFKSKYIIFTMLWPLMILPKTISLPLFFAISILLCCQYSFCVDEVTIAMWMLCMIHMISIINNVVFLNGDSSRIAAAVNTSMLWFVCGLFYSFYKSNSDKIDWNVIGIICCINIIILFVLGLVMMYFWYIKGEINHVFFGRALFGETYIDGSSYPKFIGLNQFSNMNLFFIMLMTMLVFPYLKKKRWGFKMFIIAIASFSTLLIHSRSGYILFFLPLLYMYYGLIEKKYRKIIMIIGLVMVGLLFFLKFDDVYALFLNKILNGNTSSNGFRILLLTTSWNEVVDKSPVIGMGIKRYLYDGYPLGSHSTYVGFFYKTGIIGLLIGGYIFAKTNIRAIRNIRISNCKSVMLFILCFLILFAIEDVDGANWSIMLYFSSLAMICKKGKRGYNEYKNIGNISSTVL